MTRRHSLLASLTTLIVLCSPLAMAQGPNDPDVDPEAVAALRKMGAYLGALQTAKIHADTSIDEVLDNGQKVIITGQVDYNLRKPAGFTIEVSSDRKVRKFIYDGKNLTVFAPKANFYATVAAPANNQATLDMMTDRYGIDVPLRDLFLWNEQNLSQANKLTSAIHVGFAHVNGQDTEQYAMREAGVDWQVWILRGDKPLPVKVAITTIAEPSQPEYVTNLTWTLNPTLSNEVFAFVKPADAMPILLAGQ